MDAMHQLTYGKEVTSGLNYHLLLVNPHLSYILSH